MGLILSLDNSIHSFNRAGFVGLLDQYTGAAAAYSLRRLSVNTTNVIRVRRSSDNAEADFTTDEITDGTLLAWVGNTASDNGLVTTWYDQSGNSNDATQGTAASQPKIVDAGVLVEENGRPAVDFDGVDDFLKNTTISISQPITHFTTVKLKTIAGLNRICDGGFSSTRHSLYVNSDFFYFSGLSLTQGVAENTNQNLHYFLANDTSSEAAINGSSATVGSGGTNDLGGLTMAARWDGIAQFGDLLYQEHIIYPSNQSSNRTNIETNINDYYSIYP